MNRRKGWNRCFGWSFWALNWLLKLVASNKRPLKTIAGRLSWTVWLWQSMGNSSKDDRLEMFLRQKRWGPLKSWKLVTKSNKRAIWHNRLCSWMALASLDSRAINMNNQWWGVQNGLNQPLLMMLHAFYFHRISSRKLECVTDLCNDCSIRPAGKSTLYPICYRFTNPERWIPCQAQAGLNQKPLLWRHVTKGSSDCATGSKVD